MHLFALHAVVLALSRPLFLVTTPKLHVVSHSSFITFHLRPISLCSSIFELTKYWRDKILYDIMIVTVVAFIAHFGPFIILLEVTCAQFSCRNVARRDRGRQCAHIQFQEPWTKLCLRDTCNICFTLWHRNWNLAFIKHIWEPSSPS